MRRTPAGKSILYKKTNPYRRKIKTVQFIYIFKKVGLINQAPTRKQIHTEDKPLHKKNPCG